MSNVVRPCTLSIIQMSKEVKCWSLCPYSNIQINEHYLSLHLKSNLQIAFEDYTSNSQAFENIVSKPYFVS